MSQLPEISNEDLSEADLPPPNADWGLICSFAHQYNGYEKCGSTEECAEIANSQLGGSLHNLRSCLFFEARRWRHFGEEPDAEAMTYIHRIIEDVRSLVNGSPTT